ncbi:MAG: CYTH domain-containing protein [Bacteroidales bacterium]|nr:CYTH domain-containing protein [Bacteroidales bacterium]
MAKEIERKFLVTSDAYRTLSVSACEIRQGYLSRNPDATVRVRLMGDRGFLTVKSRNRGISRDEWEYEIPARDAVEMLDRLCDGPVLAKTRYIVPAESGDWEIDEFHGRLEGLVLAEIELPAADIPVIIPDYIGREVSGDPQYYNSNLAAQA